MGFLELKLNWWLSHDKMVVMSRMDSLFRSIHQYSGLSCFAKERYTLIHAAVCTWPMEYLCDQRCKIACKLTHP